ncbi:hypothetical protein F2Q70_00023174 [Brassica cretica]|uniref:Uncharacterized protein n=2 Tax=Brassica cretica TaxID=69181 RepID=A0A8S9GV93_BRACR|nr:hypothetical protein F2Q70_00023174 [Brassica cretica]KAF2557091.1 hypothetical protein F2Q68_00017430 [Brassica cretica]KAF3610214.1 hypothetical protein DY000_02050178 [Brassica cretica]
MESRVIIATNINPRFVAESSVDPPPQSLQPDEDASHGDATSAPKKVPSSKKSHHN